MSAQNPTLTEADLKKLLQLIEDANKPGIKTTEFWTTAFTTATSIGSGIYSSLHIDSNSVDKFIPLAVMALIVFLASRQYIISRTEVKAAPLATTVLQGLVADQTSPQP